MRAFALLCVMVVLGLLVPCRAATPGETTWTLHYAVPEDVKVVVLTLAYKWWDPKIDGDVASSKELLEAKVKLPPGQTTVPIRISLSAGKSVITVGGKTFTGKGWTIDSTFAHASEPKPNYDGFYVLAQKPGDSKNPTAMGDSQNASAWIELGISPQP